MYKLTIDIIERTRNNLLSLHCNQADYVNIQLLLIMFIFPINHFEYKQNQVHFTAVDIVANPFNK